MHVIKAVIIGPTRRKHIGNVGDVKLSTPVSKNGLLLRDEDGNTEIISSMALSVDTAEYMVISWHQAQSILDAGYSLPDNSANQIRRRTKATRRFSVEEMWRERGATGERVPKPDESFLLGKAPSKIARKRVS